MNPDITLIGTVVDEWDGKAGFTLSVKGIIFFCHWNFDAPHELVKNDYISMSGNIFEHSGQLDILVDVLHVQVLMVFA